MNEPALRFPEFEGEWEDTKAGDAFNNSRAKGEAGLPIYSVTMDLGLVRRDSLERHMHGDAADETNLRAQSGDIVYNMMRMWQGAAGIADVECMVSPAYIVLSPKNHTSSEFFNYRIENARMLYLLWAYSHGLTSDRLRLYFNDFARIPVRQPSLPEQKKIAAFLGGVDAKIAALRDRQAGLERYKRGLMQALFSQRLRFTKPDGTAFPDWEEKRLGKVFDEVMEKVGARELPTYSISAGKGWVSQKEKFGKDISGQQNERYTALQVSDFSYNKGNSKSYKYGCIYPNDTGETIAVPNVFISFRAFDSETSIGFYAKIFENHYLDRGLRRLISSGARMDGLLNVNKGQFFKLKIPQPCPDEQAKIAEALSAIDAKITAVAGQLERMQTFKKGLLQQMFV